MSDSLPAIVAAKLKNLSSFVEDFPLFCQSPFNLYLNLFLPPVSTSGEFNPDIPKLLNSHCFHFLDNENDITYLLYAILQNVPTEFIQTLINQGADVNIPSLNEKLTPLHFASASGREDILQLLVENNANINATSATGWNVLHFAISKGNMNIIESLVQNYKFDIHFNDNNGTALHYAAANGMIKVIDYLITNHKMDINIKDNTGSSVLHSAVKSLQTNVIDYLVQKHNLSLDDTNDKKMTVLHIAAEFDLISMMKHLLSLSTSNVNARDYLGRSALHVAIQFGSIQIVDHIFNTIEYENIWDFNIVDNNGNSLIHYVSIYNQMDIGMFVVSHPKVDVTLENKMSNTASDINPAIEANYEEYNAILGRILHIRPELCPFKSRSKLLMFLKEISQSGVYELCNLKIQVVGERAIGKSFLKLLKLHAPLGIRSESKSYKRGLSLLRYYWTFDQSHQPAEIELLSSNYYSLGQYFLNGSITLVFFDGKQFSKSHISSLLNSVSSRTQYIYFIAIHAPKLDSPQSKKINDELLSIISHLHSLKESNPDLSVITPTCSFEQSSAIFPGKLDASILFWRMTKTELLDSSENIVKSLSDCLLRITKSQRFIIPKSWLPLRCFLIQDTLNDQDEKEIAQLRDRFMNITKKKLGFLDGDDILLIAKQLNLNRTNCELLLDVLNSWGHAFYTYDKQQKQIIVSTDFDTLLSLIKLVTKRRKRSFANYSLIRSEKRSEYIVMFQQLLQSLKDAYPDLSHSELQTTLEKIVLPFFNSFKLCICIDPSSQLYFLPGLVSASLYPSSLRKLLLQLSGETKLVRREYILNLLPHGFFSKMVIDIWQYFVKFGSASVKRCVSVDRVKVWENGICFGDINASSVSSNTLSSTSSGGSSGSSGGSVGGSSMCIAILLTDERTISVYCRTSTPPMEVIPPIHRSILKLTQTLLIEHRTTIYCYLHFSSSKIICYEYQKCLTSVLGKSDVPPEIVENLPYLVPEVCRVMPSAIFHLQRTNQVREVNTEMEKTRYLTEVQEFSEIGSGASGVVFKGKWFNQLVAIKKTPHLTDGFEIASLINEIHILQSVSHPNILRLLDIYSKPLAIVTELCIYGDLSHLLLTSIHPIVHMKILRDVSSALLYLHTLPRPIVHCDITIRNIFIKNREVSTDPTSVCAIIGDVGFSKFADTNSKSAFCQDLFQLSSNVIPNMIENLNRDLDESRSALKALVLPFMQSIIDLINLNNGCCDLADLISSINLKIDQLYQLYNSKSKQNNGEMKGEENGNVQQMSIFDYIPCLSNRIRVLQKQSTTFEKQTFSSCMNSAAQLLISCFNVNFKVKSASEVEVSTNRSHGWRRMKLQLIVRNENLTFYNTSNIDRHHLGDEESPEFTIQLSIIKKISEHHISGSSNNENNGNKKWSMKIEYGGEGNYACIKYNDYATYCFWLEALRLLQENLYPPLLFAELKQYSYSDSTTNNDISNYTIGTELGRGTSSIVYNGICKKTGKKCAIKAIDGDWEVDRVKQEIEILQRVGSHPNILQLLNVITEKQHLYLITEFVDGGDLRERLTNHSNPYIDESKVIPFIRRLIETEQFLNSKQIVHRDLKPENILLISHSNNLDDDICHFKIADFGLSKITDESQSLRTSCGSPGYIAPEVLTSGGYDCKADMWSIGVITYLLLFGNEPFYAESAPALFRKILYAKYEFPDFPIISEVAEDFISKLLVIDPSQRMSTTDALSHPWLSKSSLSPPPSPTTPSPTITLTSTITKNNNTTTIATAKLTSSQSIPTDKNSYNKHDNDDNNENEDDDERVYNSTNLKRRFAEALKKNNSYHARTFVASVKPPIPLRTPHHNHHHHHHNHNDQILPMSFLQSPMINRSPLLLSSMSFTSSSFNVRTDENMKHHHHEQNEHDAQRLYFIQIRAEQLAKSTFLLSGYLDIEDIQRLITSTHPHPHNISNESSSSSLSPNSSSSSPSSDHSNNNNNNHHHHHNINNNNTSSFQPPVRSSNLLDMSILKHQNFTTNSDHFVDEFRSVEISDHANTLRNMNEWSRVCRRFVLPFLKSAIHHHCLTITHLRFLKFMKFTDIGDDCNHQNDDNNEEEDDDDVYTVFHYACIYGPPSLVQDILCLFLIDINSTTRKTTSSALHLTVASEHLSIQEKSEISQILFDHCIDLDLRNKNGETALFCATSLGIFQLVTTLLNLRANPNIPSFDDILPIVVAAQINDPTHRQICVQSFLQFGSILIPSAKIPPDLFKYIQTSAQFLVDNYSSSSSSHFRFNFPAMQTWLDMK